MEAGAKGSEEGQAGSLHAELTEASARAHLEAAAPYAIIAAVGLWLTRVFWLPGGYVVGFDTYAYSGPNLEVTERALRRWHLPIINDLIFGGVPHLGNPSAAALYPPNLLTMVMETNRAMGVIVALHVLLLGVGTLVLARRLGLSPIGATSAGVVAMAAGSTLTKTVQFEQILVLAWIPLLLAAVHATIMSARPWRPAAALAATTAAILLAGHPQLVYQAAIFTTVATVGFVIGSGRWRRLGYVALGASLGVMIAVPQLVAVLYATADSAITGGRDLEALRSPALSLPRKYIAQAVLGTVQDRDPAAFASGFESILFIGVTVTVLSVIGAIALIGARESRSWAIAFAGIATVALMWATGPRSLLFRIAFDVVPGFDLARASSRWLVIVALVAAMFAGAGVDAMWRGAKRSEFTGVAITTLCVVGLLALGLLEVADRRSATIWVITADSALILIAANLFDQRALRATTIGLIVLASGELGLMATHSVPQQLRTDAAFTSFRTPTTNFLAEVDAGFTIALTDDGRGADYQVPGLRPNANVVNGVASIDGYDGGVQITQRWADALRRFQPDPPIELPLRNSLMLPIEPEPLARLGVRYILLDRARPAADFIPGWTGPVATDDLFEVWENPAWLGDGVAWSSAVVTDDPSAALRENAPGTADSALVPTASAVPDCSTECDPVGVDLTRPRPERIVVTTGLDRATVVSVAQQALPGWTATIDGDRIDVVVVDGIFLGASVPPGDHQVVFTYRSPWLTTTLALSMLGIAATIALAIGDTVRSRRRTQAAGGGDR